MKKIIYGCDPDSTASGFAIYINGKLDDLLCLTLIDIYEKIKYDSTYKKDCVIELHIEDLNANKCSSFNHNKKMAAAVKYKVSEKVGRCKQVQVEVERIAEHFGIKIVHHKVSKMWKKDKTQFELVTKWKGRSNEDSRSASWFGYLGLNK